MKASVLLRNVICAALVTAAGTPAFAHKENYETINISPTAFNLRNGEVDTVNLSGWRHVSKLYVSAYGQGGDATFEVVVNGDVKGTIYVPGHDPNYVVTIGEVTNSIQFRHVRGATVVVQNVKSVQAERQLSCDTCGFETRGLVVDWPTRNEAAQLARRAITLVDSLEKYASYDEYGVYLLPIKKAAARAYASANARGSISHTVYTYMVSLRNQIEFAEEYMDITFERDAVFELAVELKALGERIDSALR